MSSTLTVHLCTTQLSEVQLQYTYALHTCQQHTYSTLMHYTAVSSTTSIHFCTTQLSAVHLQYAYALHSCQQYNFSTLMHYTAVSSTLTVHLCTTQLSAVHLQYAYALHSCQQYTYNTLMHYTAVSSTLMHYTAVSSKSAVSPTQKIPIERNSSQLLAVRLCQNCKQQAVRCRIHNSLPLLGAQNQRNLFRASQSTTRFFQLLFVGSIIQFAHQYRHTIGSFRCFWRHSVKLRGGGG